MTIMHPFYFGTSRKPLFGVYHPPQRDADRHEGVVICYPFGQEYMRGHRAFRQLSMMLSRAGFHVLRFDYYGSGDSGGDARDGNVVQWVDDIHAAIDELREMSQLESVTLIGTRLGAALCVQSAATRHDVKQLVLWDPVVSGKSYLAEVVEDRFVAPSPVDDTANAVVAAAGGFPVSRQLWNELEQLDLAATLPSARTRMVVSSNDDKVARLGRLSPHAEYVVVPSKGNWNEVDNFGSALVPQEVIRDIVEWVSGGASR